MALPLWSLSRRPARARIRLICSPDIYSLQDAALGPTGGVTDRTMGCAVRARLGAGGLPSKAHQTSQTCKPIRGGPRCRQSAQCGDHSSAPPQPGGLRQIAPEPQFFTCQECRAGTRREVPTPASQRGPQGEDRRRMCVTRSLPMPSAPRSPTRPRVIPTTYPSSCGRQTRQWSRPQEEDAGQ